MKKIILLGLFSIFFVACSSNQKVLQNTTTILRGENIKIAEHIYGAPSEVRPAAKEGEKIYMWSVSTGTQVGTMSQEDTIFMGDKEKKVNKTSIVFAKLCYIAFKTNPQGKIIEGIFDGFVGYACSSLYNRTLTFCNELTKATRKTYKKPIGGCAISDYEKIKEKRSFVIPNSYVDDYYYEEDSFFNN
ncbi:MAG: hypothetical protein IJ311_05300 [Elusimicrobiaceae bacterium]|nr:hypothetical protein [Elusimicrobiaceae bacterium]